MCVCNAKPFSTRGYSNQPGCSSCEGVCGGTDGRVVAFLFLFVWGCEIRSAYFTYCTWYCSVCSVDTNEAGRGSRRVHGFTIIVEDGPVQTVMRALLVQKIMLGHSKEGGVGVFCGKTK